MTFSPEKLSQFGNQDGAAEWMGAPPWSVALCDSFQVAGTFKPRDYQYLIIIIPYAGLISTQLSHLNNRRVPSAVGARASSWFSCKVKAARRISFVRAEFWS